MSPRTPALPSLLVWMALAIGGCASGGASADADSGDYPNLTFTVEQASGRPLPGGLMRWWRVDRGGRVFVAAGSREAPLGPTFGDGFEGRPDEREITRLSASVMTTLASAASDIAGLGTRDAEAEHPLGWLRIRWRVDGKAGWVILAEVEPGNVDRFLTTLVEALPEGHRVRRFAR